MTSIFFDIVMEYDLYPEQNDRSHLYFVLAHSLCSCAGYILTECPQVIDQIPNVKFLVLEVSDGEATDTVFIPGGAVHCYN
ncbi:MAG: hypothetical protein TR69_WS6001000939 [candidate division WS6 bacterium OLB20]|uniref:Uncharacterized protein n=1 Tax=candidate division WS6 bacterium OLB20 TaxID=1617426 RepID=A0A136LZ67_9BACT|nr:MAG: hypothetical protein TR69_WS6001000939 [candidate division WS6 bacterium OLB20]